MDPVSGSSQTNGPPVCVRCNKHIYDGTIFQVQEKYWHNACIQCVICRKQINGCCHMKDSELYCRTDFVRLFGAKCSSCKKVIPPSEAVHVANSNVYHTACFTCSTCTCQLHPGDYFYVKDDGKLICSSDYQNILSEDRAETDSDTDESGSDDTDTRYRTRFNDNQLRMLTETYQSNKRPSRAERKRISLKTGLNLRTVQIWFQNRRAKDKTVNNRNKRQYSYHNNGYHPGNKRNNHISHGNGICNENTRSVETFTQQPLQQEYSTQISNTYQLYCPLDYLVPNEMPPNVDLSSTDIRNGELVAGKHITNNFHVTQQTPAYLPENIAHWLTA